MNYFDNIGGDGRIFIAFVFMIILFLFSMCLLKYKAQYMAIEKGMIEVKYNNKTIWIKPEDLKYLKENK
jgi:hypothetical protein